MDKPDLEWVGWAMVVSVWGGIGWHLWSRHVRDKALQKTRTPRGVPVYTWKTPFGVVKTARAHPGLQDGRGDGGFAGGDWGDCGDGGD
ncbi:hypothetical protein AB2B41_14805 [Marimonas sp. MJW-29]|uniref:Uncharacterized protein n=1 Tax=Sulfitobacter sediminis TaxID=3234186 RepID=A0ABV3RQP1_9RHOB